MRSLRFGHFLTVAAASVFLVQPVLAQKEVALTLGQISGPNRTTQTGAAVTPSNALAVQGSFGQMVRSYKLFDLYGEVNAVVSPYQTFSSTATAVTKHAMAFYVTPGVRLKFYPKKKLSPFALVGGGAAIYSTSARTIAGGATANSGSSASGAVEFGGGLEYRKSSQLSIRFEARNFYTGTPHYGVPVSGRSQFNFLVGGGLVFHLGGR